MITTTALALDNGFRIVIVLTSDNVSLVEQTRTRFSLLRGAVVRSSDRRGGWLDDADHIAKALQHGGLVLVTAKNVSHLKRFCGFLESVGAAGYPALILDDEADQASLDTNVKKRAQARARGEDVSRIDPSRIFDWTNGEESLRAGLPHHLYLQVTATPYALLLQNMDSSLRPSFTEIIEPGDGYVGGHFFFDRACFRDGGRPPLCFVSSTEHDVLVKERKLPEGLELALATFLVATAAQGLAHPKYKHAAQNFLVHTSVRKAEHAAAAEVIRERLGRLYQNLFEPVSPTSCEAFLQRGLNELGKTVSKLPSLEETREYVKFRLIDREVLVVNSEKDNAQFGPRLNFIVGGNILGRGLTIDNLLATYYLRSAGVAQMDTMLQHARMFGYRAGDKPYLRVFIPELQAARFEQIQTSERNLREFLAENSGDGAVVEVEPGLRATRPNVLDPYMVEAYKPGDHVYPAMPYVEGTARRSKPSASERVHAQAYERFLAAFYDGESSVFGRQRPKFEDRIHTTTISDICDALDWLPSPKEAERRGSWNPRVLKAILRACSDRFGNEGRVYARSAKRETITQGMMGPDELRDLKALGCPVLCAFWDDSLGLAKNPGVLGEVTFPYLFPEFVFPTTARGQRLPAQVVNVDGLLDE
jgi:hypothetical protein